MIDEFAIYAGLPALGILSFLSISLGIKLLKRTTRTLSLALAFALSLTIGFVVLNLTLLVNDQSQTTALIIGLASTPNLILLWLFIRSLFEDNFVIGLPEWSIGGAYLVLMIWERLALADIWPMPRVVALILGLFSLSLMGHLVVSLLRGRAIDLVEGRRKSRLWIVGAIIAAGIISVLAQNSVNLIPADWARLISLLSIGVATLIITVYVAPPELEALQFDRRSNKAPSRQSLTAKDKIHYDKLVSHMEDNKAYLDPKLTINKLARELGLGEHALRALINQRLGYRNYTDFINQYRIAHAKSAFEDPEKAHIPILTIAMDSGYNSLSAFNRAFRLIEDETPSEFRKRQKIS